MAAALVRELNRVRVNTHRVKQELAFLKVHIHKVLSLWAITVLLFSRVPELKESPMHIQFVKVGFSLEDKDTMMADPTEVQTLADSKISKPSDCQGSSRTWSHGC